MKASRRRLLAALGILLVSTLGALLIAYALRGNINLFYPPALVAAQEAPLEVMIRVGGMVREGSVRRVQGALDVDFVLTDFSFDVPVRYSGLLPDLFAEGQGAVARGMLGADGVFRAVEVLAKHDENYMPPELKDMAKQAGY